MAHTLKKPIAVKGGLSLSADRVFISRLPDFSFGPDGNYCDTREPALYNLPHWGPSTWAWLSLQGSLFAHTVRAAASTYGWHYIGYNEKAFSKRGFCNLTNSLFAGLWGTVSQFDIAGGFHPIAEAHLLARDMLVPVLCKRLYKTADCTGAPR